MKMLFLLKQDCEEFNLHKYIDYDTMFEKTFLELELNLRCN